MYVNIHRLGFRTVLTNRANKYCKMYRRTGIARLPPPRLMFPLPGYDSDGRKVIFGRLGAWDPSKHKPEDLFKAAGMLFDVMFLEDEQMTVTGIVQANDMTGLTLKHVAALPLPLIKRVSTTWQVRSARPSQPDIRLSLKILSILPSLSLK